MPLSFETQKNKLNKYLLKNRWTAPTGTDEEIEISKLLSELTLYSTTVFVVLVLLFRFILNSFTAILIKMYSIHFIYRLFDIQFTSVDSSKWPADRILLVFGFGYVIFTFLGIFLVFIYRKIHNVNWKTRLILTWMAFLLANSIPAGIVAGALFFTNFGIVYTWLVSSFFTRLIIGAAALLMMAMLRRFWVFMFLKASPSSVFLNDEETMTLYIQHVFFKSWVYGFLILLVFNWPMLNGFWPLYLLSLGFTAMPLFNLPGLQEEIYIRKSVVTIFPSPKSLYYIIGALAIVRIAGSLFKIYF